MRQRRCAPFCDGRIAAATGLAHRRSPVRARDPLAAAGLPGRYPLRIHRDPHHTPSQCDMPVALVRRPPRRRRPGGAAPVGTCQRHWRDAGGHRGPGAGRGAPDLDRDTARAPGGAPARGPGKS